MESRRAGGFHEPVTAPSRVGRWIALLAGLLAACGAEVEAPRVLTLVQVRPANPEAVFLNEPIVFHFSEDLDPSSVTSASLAVTGPDGERARGEFEVAGSQVRFVPAPVLAAALDDGGFLPGRRYRAVLAGFPRPDALRGRSGAPLERSLEWRFRAADRDSPSGLFVDRTPGTPLALQLAPGAGRIGPAEPISIVGQEPVDPSTVSAEDFVLQPVLTTRPRPELGDPVPLLALLRDNRERRFASTRPGMHLELRPRIPLEPGLYQLRLDPERFGLQDLGGNRAFVRGLGPGQVHVVEVVERPSESQSGTYRESFLDPATASTARVPGADGAAWWGGTGRVEVRYPRAAGDGADGATVLGAVEERRDVRATRLELPAGGRCELAREPGLVVLRAQGSLEIDGTLVRGAVGPPDWIRPSEGPPRTLTSWLEDAAASESSWTVLVAGGDLLVRGELRVAGPLLLVAGGRIRNSGTITSAQEDGVFRLREGGGGGLLAHEAPLVVDPPQANPLREPLTFSVLSAPLPPSGGVRRWRPRVNVGGHAGAGSYRVRFLHVDDVPGLGDPAPRGVDYPAALDADRSLRLWIELHVPPSDGAWDPPWVDFVEFAWDQLEGAG